MRDRWGRRLLRTACRIVCDVYEWEQRRVLLDRPWEEDFLHWVHDQDGWHLHGHLPPPRGRCPCPTAAGWCLGQAREREQHSTGERPG